ncbi:Uncharacterized protein MBO1_00119 [Mycobacterium tuberculosis variant bovis]|uniref:Uncharacterized protein n=2 Tax=Mycobacterium tuberculosis TaxID=1773 RepID=A0A654TLC3_MYCTX|nr:hypothetical protein [Mycobacterium tuberculosis]AGL25942.1 hypothetical protein J113_03350 [Mycobacterium tuberculosis CAS/NITR204]CEJ32952.1 Uncharacterized protein MBO_503392 [Mycobacterium tuberculosis variant bovis]CEJ50885.1 Uncharacterized protein MBO_201114 [Mycobacterium tuberculosis variant caprae]CEJ34047.1 Uncharacterized protein MBO1_00119 [Mycobacterium tuberculosis variant bovis]CFE39287.1 Uncharacterised protein [Mycobacterium tuberculosis]
MAPTKNPTATTFIRRSAIRRAASASGSAAAKDSAKEARTRRATVGWVLKFSRGGGEPDTSALCATTPSSAITGTS